MKYNKKFDQILEKLSNIDDEECQNIKKEIQVLSDIYNKKEDRLNKIIKLSDKQQMAILELNEELDRYQNHLENKVQEEIEKRKEQEEMLFEQSRLAAIAEMIDAVAHQWIQPLNILSMYIEILKLEADDNNGISPEAIEKFKNNTSLQINHLVETLNNFRSFFRPIKEAKEFFIKDAIDSILKLIDDDIKKYNINLKVKIEKDFTLIGNENEFKHIILNFISNSKYAFLNKNIKDRNININILGDEKKVEFIDNAGGIKDEIIEHIFDMHITTKGDKGTGIGLYMSQQIAKKHHGLLSVENIEDGVKFTFQSKDAK